MAAAGYGLMRGVHIRADFLYRNWTDENSGDCRRTALYAFLYSSDDLSSLGYQQNFGGKLFQQEKLTKLIVHGDHCCGPLELQCH